MRNSIIIFLVFILCGCADGKKTNAPVVAKAEQNTSKIPTYDFEGLEPMLHRKDGKTYVINFWATWCKPCIKELPLFEELHQKYADENVEVILVSLDFPEQVESRLLPFIKKKNLKSTVVFLDDPKSNDWIPKVSQDWSGAIPATLIYNKDNSQFYERSFEGDELETELMKFLE